MEDESLFPDALVNPRLVDNYIMGIVGNIGSGKTFLTNQLIQMWKYKFDIIVWISPTYELEDNSLVRDKTGIVVFDRFSVENLNKIPQALLPTCCQRSP